MKVEGGVPLKLTDGDYNDILPSWSQDGKWIYFGSRRSGGWQIWKVAVGNKELRRVTKNGGFSANKSLEGKSGYYTKYHMLGLWQGPCYCGERSPLLKSPPALL